MLKLGVRVFLKMDAKRLKLVAFQSIKIIIFLGKLKTSYMDDIWKNISTATVIIPSACMCLNILYWNVTMNKNGKD